MLTQFEKFCAHEENLKLSDKGKIFKFFCSYSILKKGKISSEGCPKGIEIEKKNSREIISNFCGYFCPLL